MTTIPAPLGAKAEQPQSLSEWTADDAANLYGLPGWGLGYFGVSKRGTVVVNPRRDRGASVDLFGLIEGLAQRGVHTPVLVRFDDIVKDRAQRLHSSFKRAMADQEYKGGYSCVYPIKVNQQKHVVELVRDVGEPLGFGLEAGSKPELLAVLALTENRPHMPVVCNGFKDDEYIEMVVLAAKLGRNIIPVVEKYSELEMLVKHAKRYGVKPKLGVRVKIDSRGVGRWGESAGSRSKFGLFISEILRGMDYLRENDMLGCLRMIHFHMGSQICDIRNLKNALNELAHIYTEMRRLGASSLDIIDIGGGLGVDYDGSQSSSDSSMNYTIEEYASDVIYRIKSVCDDAKAPHPMIISESGRALVAHSSVLVFDVRGSSRFDKDPAPDELDAAMAAEEEVPQPIIDLIQASQDLSDKNILETYHDALQARDEAMSLFGLGYISLPMRAIAERLFWSVGRKILERVATRQELPDELQDLPDIMSDIYFCNMSIFQSMPDSWAIDQLFPILPIHRLTERPMRRGILADITCDSDGKIDNFVDKRDVKKTLELHDLKPGEPYYLAAFLVGAYQEILGDLHNLLADTHTVHVSIDDDGDMSIDEVVRGDTVSTALSYVQFDQNELKRSVRRDVERAVKRGDMSITESTALLRFYEDGLAGYTYLED
ncbi:MAG: biosynthetic arginine decarboxylase [Phycisphaeraceae bacterium]|nr:biosynthetic arginine decarboxylase [Phycisphaeraceae bacterium]